ncbi:MAG: hypothetical protein EBR40_09995 [Proteobacteria bacterium]|nr:hypothetical protein [Pseudomonadota bacterium]
MQNKKNTEAGAVEVARINAQVENPENLTRDELTCVKIIESTINSRCETLEKAREWVACLSGWFVYRGGSHIAVHRDPSGPRVLLVAEVK